MRRPTADDAEVGHLGYGFKGDGRELSGAFVGFGLLLLGDGGSEGVAGGDAQDEAEEEAKHQAAAL